MKLSGEFYNRLSDEDKLLVSRVHDMVNISSKSYKPRFSLFLDEMQLTLAVSVVNSLDFGYAVWGGFDNASRQILGVFADNYSDDIHDEFPVSALTFKYRSEDKLSHRDFLGSFMSKKIARNMIGDIIVNDGYTVAFVHKNAESVILDECAKIGSVGVRISVDNNPQIVIEEHFSEIQGTVSSLRLDSIVSLATKLSREKSAVLINGGNVSVRYGNIKSERHNFAQYNNELSPSKMLSDGDVFSIRGFGKFILFSVGNKTKKDRLHVCIKKYI